MLPCIYLCLQCLLATHAHWGPVLLCAGMSVYNSREVQDHQIARIIGKVGAVLMFDGVTQCHFMWTRVHVCTLVGARLGCAQSSVTDRARLTKCMLVSRHSQCVVWRSCRVGISPVIIMMKMLLNSMPCSATHRMYHTPCVLLKPSRRHWHVHSWPADANPGCTGIPQALWHAVHCMYQRTFCDAQANLTGLAHSSLACRCQPWLHWHTTSSVAPSQPHQMQP
jgi:hypothetical protein